MIHDDTNFNACLGEDSRNLKTGATMRFAAGRIGVKLRWGVLLGVILFGSGFARAGTSVEHRFESGETLWFLAQIYYGDGLQFEKIMRANRLKSSEQVHEGQPLKIQDPIFKPGQPGFELRLAHLRTKRAEALARRRFIASERISVKDSAHVTLPRYPQGPSDNLPEMVVKEFTPPAPEN